MFNLIIRHQVTTITKIYLSHHQKNHRRHDSPSASLNIRVDGGEKKNRKKAEIKIHFSQG